MNNHLLQIIPGHWMCPRLSAGWLRIVILLMLMPLSLGIYAQTFLKTFQDTAIGMSVYEKPDGYHILCAAPVSGSTHFTWFDTDLNGNKTGYDIIGPEIVGNTIRYSVLANDDIIAAGFTEADTVVSIKRLTPQGQLIWEYRYVLGESNEGGMLIDNIFIGGLEVEEGADGGLYLGGYFENETDLTYDFFLLKLTADGQLAWSDRIDNQAQFILDLERVFKLEPGVGDEGVLLLFNGYDTNTVTDDNITIRRYADDGQILSSFTGPFSVSAFQPRGNIGALPQGRFFYMVTTYTPQGETNKRLRIYDSTGNIESEVNLTEMFKPALDNDAYLNVELPLPDDDGNFIILLGTSADVPKRIIVKITPQGQLIWQKSLPQLTVKRYDFPSAKILADGSCLFAGGYRDNLNSPFSQMALLKVGSDGTLFPNTLSGLVKRDDNFNCLADSTETGLANWMLEISKNGNNWNVTTGADGNFATPADSGLYTLTLTAPNYLWDICDNPQEANVLYDSLGQTYTTDFAAAPLAECPFMQVDILANYLQAGADNTYIFHYCNTGTADASGVGLTVAADPLLTLVAASAPFTIIDGDIHFEIGDVPAGVCNDITAVFNASGDPASVGESVCVVAHITPDSICLPVSGAWSGAILEARGYCDGDSVRFEVKNIGSGTSAPNLNYIIADDHVIMFQGELPALLPGAQTSYTVPATGGSWRFTADQEPGMPVEVAPSMPVEGCAAGGNPVSLGIAVQMSNSTGNPFSDMECRILYDEIPAQMLSCNPSGVPANNTVLQGTTMEYQVHFQTNTPVNEVVIVDSLPAELDISTLQPGPSTSPYTWSLGGNGILYLRFDKVAGGLQEGTVKFSVQLREGLADGTEIYNRAALFYDQKLPEITNTTFHTIGTIFTTVGVQAPENNLLPLNISPNPALDYTVVQLPVQHGADSKLLLRNVLGNVVLEKSVSSDKVRLDRNNLPAGVYLLEYQENGRMVGQGKIVWE